MTRTFSNQSDLKNRESEVLTARKAEAFRILSGGIAHDYNNLLSIIWGNISLLREDIGDDGAQAFFDAAEKAPAYRERDNSTGGQDLRLTFKDCGRGIPETDLPKVFDPYFTTKELGGRRGLHPFEAL